MSLILLVLQIIISILLIITILLQRSDSDGFGLGASGGSNFLSSRGQANLMTKLTSILAAAFMANSLLLATINARSGSNSIADEIMLEQSKDMDFQVPKEGEKTPLPPVEEPKVEAPKLAPLKNAPLKNAPLKNEVPAIEVPTTTAPNILPTPSKQKSE